MELEFENSGNLGKPLQKEWLKEIKNKRVIRSNFIVDGYHVERVLTEVLALAMLPNVKDASANIKTLMDDRRGCFQQLILDPMRFYSKIQLLQDLGKSIPLIAKEMQPNLVSRLHQIRITRNRFAHYPIRFDVRGKPPKHKWSATLICKDEEIALTSKYIFVSSVQFTEVSYELTRLLVMLR